MKKINKYFIITISILVIIIGFYLSNTRHPIGLPLIYTGVIISMFLTKKRTIRLILLIIGILLSILSVLF